MLPDELQQSQPQRLEHIVRTSSRPAVATLSDPLNVSAMSKPTMTSDTRSAGSSTRVDLSFCTSDIGPGEDEVEKCLAVTVIGADMPARAVVGEDERNDVPCSVAAGEQ